MTWRSAFVLRSAAGALFRASGPQNGPLASLEWLAPRLDEGAAGDRELNR
jgi:hypothetical protein